MVIKLEGKELQQMITEVVEKVSQTEVFAGLIWHFCINSQDHLYNGEYYDLPASFKYDNEGVNLLEVNYLQQRNQWTLFSTDYKHILRIAPLVLKWMDDTYFAYVASQQQARALNGAGRRKNRRGTRRRRQRPRKRAIAPSPSILTTPLSQPQSSSRQRQQTQTQAGTQERQREQGDNQQNGDSQNNFS